MDSFLQDLRYAVRTLLKNPAFAITAVLTLAVGIGASTAIFSVVNRILIEPLPFKSSERLVFLSRSNPRAGIIFAPSPQIIRQWKDQSQSFEGIEAYDPRRFTLTGVSEPEIITGAQVTAGLLPFLGVTPLFGRNFEQGDAGPGTERVALISHAFWRNRFTQSADVLGKSVMLGGENHTIVGVLPPGFNFPPGNSQIWTPLDLGSNTDLHVRAIARLKPGVDLERAQAEMDFISARVAPESGREQDWKTLVSFPSVNPDLRTALIVLFCATGLLVLIACANVSNLLLARGVSREKDGAVRSALGASRLRLARQVLVESLVLGLSGATVGFLFSFWGLDLILALSPDALMFDDVQIDHRVLTFTLGLSLLTSLIFGLAPAWRLLSPNISEVLKAGGATHSGSRSHHRLRTALVVSEIAVSLILLIAAGLLVQTFLKLQNVNLGFNPQNLLTLRIALPKEKYSRTLREVFFDDLVQRAGTLPGVASVAVASNLPPFGGIFGFGDLEVEGRMLAESDAPFRPSGGFVDRDYFKTMGIRLLRGRSFTSEECGQGSKVVVVNKETAQRLWSLEVTVGKRIRFKGDKEWLTVVGVVEDVAIAGPAQRSPGFQFYFPFRQFMRNFDADRFSSFLVLRTSSDLAQLIPAVKMQVWSLDPDLPIPEIATMEDRVSVSIARPLFNMTLLSLFATLALLLASVGIYGVVSCWVGERVRELAVRRALGAQRGHLIWSVLSQGGITAAVGIAVGLAGALASTHLIKGLLFGISAVDPLTFIILPALMLAVTLLACWIPARRAASVDPMEALRYE